MFSTYKRFTSQFSVFMICSMMKWTSVWLVLHIILYTDFVQTVNGRDDDLLKGIASKSQPQNPHKEYKRVCYYTNWSQYRSDGGKFFPKDIDPFICTHVIFAFAKIQNGVLAPYEWNDLQHPFLYKQFTDLKKQNPKLKTLLAVGGWTHGSQPFTAMVATKSSRSKFINHAIQYLRTHNFDGLDLDWEYPANRGSPAHDKHRLTLLVKELREAFEDEARRTGRDRLLLSMAVPGGPRITKSGYEVKELDKYIDFFNLMSYDLHGTWSSKVGHHAPLFGGEKWYDAKADSYTVDGAVRLWLGLGASRDKLILGLALYGKTFKLCGKGSEPGQRSCGAPHPDSLKYYQIAQRLRSGQMKRHWLKNELVPYGHDTRDKIWVGYDDEESLREKVRYAMSQGLGGVMAWSIDEDDFKGQFGRSRVRYPLLSAVKDALLSGLGKDGRFYSKLSKLEKTESKEERHVHLRNEKSSAKEQLINNKSPLFDIAPRESLKRPQAVPLRSNLLDTPSKSAEISNLEAVKPLRPVRTRESRGPVPLRGNRKYAPRRGPNRAIIAGRLTPVVSQDRVNDARLARQSTNESKNKKHSIPPPQSVPLLTTDQLRVMKRPAFHSPNNAASLQQSESNSRPNVNGEQRPVVSNRPSPSKRRRYPKIMFRPTPPKTQINGRSGTTRVPNLIVTNYVSRLKNPLTSQPSTPRISNLEVRNPVSRSGPAYQTSQPKNGHLSLYAGTNQMLQNSPVTDYSAVKHEGTQADRKALGQDKKSDNFDKTGTDESKKDNFIRQTLKKGKRRRGSRAKTSGVNPYLGNQPSMLFTQNQIRNTAYSGINNRIENVPNKDRLQANNAPLNPYKEKQFEKSMQQAITLPNRRVKGTRRRRIIGRGPVRSKSSTTNPRSHIMETKEAKQSVISSNKQPSHFHSTSIFQQPQKERFNKEIHVDRAVETIADAQKPLKTSGSDIKSYPTLINSSGRETAFPWSDNSKGQTGNQQQEKNPHTQRMDHDRKFNAHSSAYSTNLVSGPILPTHQKQTPVNKTSSNIEYKQPMVSTNIESTVSEQEGHGKSNRSPNMEDHKDRDEAKAEPREDKMDKQPVRKSELTMPDVKTENLYQSQDVEGFDRRKRMRNNPQQNWYDEEKEDSQESTHIEKEIKASNSTSLNDGLKNHKSEIKAQNTNFRATSPNNEHYSTPKITPSQEQNEEGQTPKPTNDNASTQSEHSLNKNSPENNHNNRESGNNQGVTEKLKSDVAQPETVISETKPSPLHQVTKEIHESRTTTAQKNNEESSQRGTSRMFLKRLRASKINSLSPDSQNPPSHVTPKHQWWEPKDATKVSNSPKLEKGSRGQSLGKQMYPYVGTDSKSQQVITNVKNKGQQDRTEKSRKRERTPSKAVYGTYTVLVTENPSNTQPALNELRSNINDPDTTPKTVTKTRRRLFKKPRSEAYQSQIRSISHSPYKPEAPQYHPMQGLGEIKNTAKPEVMYFPEKSVDEWLAETSSDLISSPDLDEEQAREMRELLQNETIVSEIKSMLGEIQKTYSKEQEPNTDLNPFLQRSDSWHNNAKRQEETDNEVDVSVESRDIKTDAPTKEEKYSADWNENSKTGHNWWERVGVYGKNKPFAEVGYTEKDDSTSVVKDFQRALADRTVKRNKNYKPRESVISDNMVPVRLNNDRTYTDFHTSKFNNQNNHDVTPKTTTTTTKARRGGLNELSNPSSKDEEKSLLWFRYASPTKTTTLAKKPSQTALPKTRLDRRVDDKKMDRDLNDWFKNKDLWWEKPTSRSRKQSSERNEVLPKSSKIGNDDSSKNLNQHQEQGQVSSQNTFEKSNKDGGTESKNSNSIAGIEVDEILGHIDTDKFLAFKKKHMTQHSEQNDADFSRKDKEEFHNKHSSANSVLTSKADLDETTKKSHDMGQSADIYETGNDVNERKKKVDITPYRHLAKPAPQPYQSGWLKTPIDKLETSNVLIKLPGDTRTPDTSYTISNAKTGFRGDDDEFLCPSTFGIYSDPYDCRKFYQCVWFVAFHHVCGFGTQWNHIDRICDWPTNTDCIKKRDYQ